MLFIICAYFPAAAQQELLENVQEKFNSASTLTADISQNSGNSVLKGKIFLKKENKLRLEFKNITIISDGFTIWNYNKKDNKVVINNFDENAPSALSFNKIINEYPAVSNISYADGQKNVLLIKPDKDSGLNFQSVRLWVNNENLVEKVRIEQGGNPMEISVSNYSLNKDIPDSRFTFTPRQDSQIIDLR
jgi:outer membrane lipoprotein-sorting protein